MGADLEELLVSEPPEPSYRLEEFPYLIWVAIPGTNFYDGTIMWASQAIKAHDILNNSVTVDDNAIDIPKHIELSPGLWEFKLRPWSNGPDINGEYDAGSDVIEHRLIQVFPAYPKV